MGREKRRILIFGALGYFKSGPFCKAEVAVFQTPSPLLFQMFESGSEKFSNSRIQLLFKLRLPTMQLKFSNVFIKKYHIGKSHKLLLRKIKKRLPF